MFRDTADLFDGCEFPATCDDVVTTLGDAELELPNGTESAAEAVARGGSDTFETREDAQLALANGVGRAAIGRSHYSDRDPTAPGDEGPRQISF